MSHWTENAPLSLIDPNDPDGVPIATPLDRRWLWRLEGFLAIHTTTEYHREMARDLRQYLNETCEHHWRPYPGDDFVSAHAQCLWCNHVEWLNGPAEAAA